MTIQYTNFVYCIAFYENENKQKLTPFLSFLFNGRGLEEGRGGFPKLKGL